MNEAQDRQEALRGALEHLEEAAELLAYATEGDEYFRRTSLAQLQGREHGWMGEFLVDEVRGRLAASETEFEDANQGA